MMLQNLIYMANLKTNNSMKKIVTLLFLLISFVSFSQMNRRIGGSQNMNNNNRTPEKIDPIQTPLDYLKKELNLDTFQEAAIKTYLVENLKEKEYILSLDLTENVKIDKLKVSYDKMDSQIESLLNNKQKEAFVKLKAKQRGSVKKKKNKKENPEELENQ